MLEIDQFLDIPRYPRLAESRAQNQRVMLKGFSLNVHLATMSYVEHGGKIIRTTVRTVMQVPEPSTKDKLVLESML